MKCVDVLIGVAQTSGVVVVEADTGKTLGTIDLSDQNSPYCRTTLKTLPGDFATYTQVMIDNYTKKRLLLYWNYGPDKVVLDVPEDTGPLVMREITDYSVLTQFAGFIFKTVKLKNSNGLFVDPAYPIISLNGTDEKKVPMTPFIQAALGSILVEV